MMRGRFEEQLSDLNNQLIEMGSWIELSIATAIEALQSQDAEKARKAISVDAQIDQKEKDIEALCLRLLLRQQPVARDLRLISAALKMITDMERIGDQAADIAEISLYLSEETLVQKMVHIPQMAVATSKMVTQSINAFVKRDLALAREVIDYDDVVDGLFTEVKDDLIELIQADRSSASQAMDLLMISKYFERIGDHAVNIAEWVEFSITGRHSGEQGGEKK